MSTAIEGCLVRARRGEAVQPFVASLLYALQYVREQQLLLYRQPVPTPPKPTGSAAPSSLEAATAAEAAFVPPPPPYQALLDALNCFFQHLDWLSIAEAACSIRWYSHALQWIERFKQRHDAQRSDTTRSVSASHKRSRNGSPPSDAAREVESLERYHSLLLLVYQQVEDTDSLHGALETIPHTVASSSVD